MRLNKMSYGLLAAFLAMQACGSADKQAKELTEPKKVIAEIQEDAKNTSAENSCTATEVAFVKWFNKFSQEINGDKISEETNKKTACNTKEIWAGLQLDPTNSSCLNFQNIATLARAACP